MLIQSRRELLLSALAIPVAAIPVVEAAAALIDPGHEIVIRFMKVWSKMGDQTLEIDAVTLHNVALDCSLELMDIVEELRKRHGFEDDIEDDLRAAAAEDEDEVPVTADWDGRFMVADVVRDRRTGRLMSVRGVCHLEEWLRRYTPTPADAELVCCWFDDLYRYHDAKFSPASVQFVRR